MVYSSSGQRKAIKKRSTALAVSIIIILLATIAGVVMLLYTSSLSTTTQQPVVMSDASAEKITKITEVEQIEAIDFQPIIDDWANTITGNKSVLIYDIELEAVAGSYNTTEFYNTASLYKLFVVYEGYRRLQTGAWAANDMVNGTGYTTLECLDLAIRESYSPCAEALWAKIGHSELDAIIKDEWGIMDSNISGLESNAEDITKIMLRFYQHPEITDVNLLSVMQDSFLNQPATTYNWRQGLPSGFTRALVYNKVGWSYGANRWDIYHDAAIVEFPEDGRHFVVVVMTNYVDYSEIRELGALLEDYFYAQVDL